MAFPTMAKREGDEEGGKCGAILHPRNRLISTGEREPVRPYTRTGKSQTRYAGGKVPKGSLRQHNTCDMSNAGTGTDSR